MILHGCTTDRLHGSLNEFNVRPGAVPSFIGYIATPRNKCSRSSSSSSLLSRSLFLSLFYDLDLPMRVGFAATALLPCCLVLVAALVALLPCPGCMVLLNEVSMVLLIDVVITPSTITLPASKCFRHGRASGMAVQLTTPWRYIAEPSFLSRPAVVGSM